MGAGEGFSLTEKFGRVFLLGLGWRRQRWKRRLCYRVVVLSLDNQLGRMLRWFSGCKKGIPVGGLQVGKRGQDRGNPGETCFSAYSGERVLRKTSVLLGPRVLGRYSGVES